VCVVLMLCFAVGAFAEDEDKDKKKGPDEPSAARTIRQLNNAQMAYANAHKDEGFACTIKQLADVSGAALPAELGSGKFRGYHFKLNCAEGDKPYIRVTMVALPVDTHEGARSFCSDMYVSMGKVIGGVINAAKDGKEVTCLVKGAPVR
jgi:hypothetical protein